MDHLFVLLFREKKVINSLLFVKNFLFVSRRLLLINTHYLFRRMIIAIIMDTFDADVICGVHLIIFVVFLLIFLIKSFQACNNAILEL